MVMLLQRDREMWKSSASGDKQPPEQKAAELKAKAQSIKVQTKLKESLMLRKEHPQASFLETARRGKEGGEMKWTVMKKLLLPVFLACKAFNPPIHNLLLLREKKLKDKES